MKIIGVTGLIASGKSEAARIFAALGAELIDADKEAHKVLKKSGAAYADVLAAFGDGIMGDDGEIDRRKLGGIVFSDKSKLELLGNLTHKHIRNSIDRSISTISASRNRCSILIDAVLLYESELYKLCDKWFIVDADEDIRLARIMARDGLSVESAYARIMSQEHLKSPEKSALADYIIENNGGPDEFRLKTEALARNVL